MTTRNPILLFYSGMGPDHVGRYWSTVLHFSDSELEYTHDYIQWIFPLTEPSAFNPHAPLLDNESRKCFATDDRLQANMCEACRRLLTFYGLLCRRVDQSGREVILSESFSERSRHWVSPNNHNHLRLTRILKSLRLCGRANCSAMLYQCLERIAATCPAGLTPETLTCWRRSQQE